MTSFTSPDSEANIDSASLLQMLRRKEKTWLDWGLACQQLQKTGYSPQQIFEETGFEPIQQNQIVVASQVYKSLVDNAPETVLNYFGERRSDILYELRVLNHGERVDAATLAANKQLDVDEAHIIAKAIKEFYQLKTLPPGFTKTPGDAMAYRCWHFARQKSDLQARSQLIGQGLKFAQSDTAREQLQQLLSDFTVVKTPSAPHLPFFRLESEEELPRLMPVVGHFPLTLADFKAVPMVDEEGAFGVVKYAGTCAWVAVPGWQVILRAEDPVALLAPVQDLEPDLPQPTEEVLVIIDRAQRQWNPDSYFLTAASDSLQVTWFTDAPEQKLLGQVILVMRPKRVLDEDYTKDPWQIDE
jgi:hypothetical protein